MQYPNTLIACIEPIIDSWFDDKPLLTGIVDGQEQTVNDMNDDKAIYYETGSTANPWLVCETDFVDYTHPTVRDNRKFAARLLEQITEDVHRFFPNTCRGSGIVCETGLIPSPTVTPTFFPTIPSANKNTNTDII